MFDIGTAICQLYVKYQTESLLARHTYSIVLLYSLSRRVEIEDIHKLSKDLIGQIDNPQLCQ